MGLRKLGKHTALAKNFRTTDGAGIYSGTGFPKSGPSGTTVNTRIGVGAKTGAFYVDANTGAVFANEGTAASPYWTPVSILGRAIHGWYTDFRDGVGKALADTAASATVTGSGLRIHGASIVDTDAGLTIAHSDQGNIASLVTGNENPDAVVLSFGTGTTALFKPSVNGTMVVDALVAQSSAITNRSFFLGFIGSAADAIAAPITGSGTTISFANTFSDDIAGLAFSTGLTATDRWYVPYDKGNTNASIATTATGVDTGVTKAAAGTYERLRIEVDSDGAVRAFIDKVRVANLAAGTLATTTALHPVLVQNTLTTANATALIKHFGAWGVRA